MREATKRFSSESAIRPFLEAFPEDTLAFVHTLTGDDNHHVRRLTPEDIRPFLPWAMRVDLPLDAVVGVLDRVHADLTRYVTRSVANGRHTPKVFSVADLGLGKGGEATIRKRLPLRPATGTGAIVPSGLAHPGRSGTACAPAEFDQSQG